MEPGILVYGAFLGCETRSTKNGPFTACAVACGMDAYRIGMDNVDSYNIMKDFKLGTPVIFKVRVYARENGFGLGGGKILAAGDDAAIIADTAAGVM